MTTIVIGAGIIGTTLAYTLQKRGREVILIERDEPGKGASFGNMASIAVTEFLPASRPSIWKKIPGWLLDPDGPVSVSPAYMPRVLPWLLRFMAASRPSKLRQLEEQGAALCVRVFDDLLPLLRETGLESELSEEGCLAIYANEGEFQAGREQIEILDRFGIPYEAIDRQAIKDLEPEISDKISRAVHFPRNRSVRDPYKLVCRFADAFRQLGGRIEKANVVDFVRSTQINGVRLKDGRAISADEIVICAGAHTVTLASMLGETFPLETERGYHTHIMSPGISMKHSLIWPSRAFMVTPTAGGIRVGGTVEMAGLQAPPNFRRSKATVQHAKEALPNLACVDFTEWMEHRPALPDTVPVMSASSKTKGVFYATGHGHLGLTYAATNARLMADLITGQIPPVDMRPYRIDRF